MSVSQRRSSFPTRRVTPSALVCALLAAFLANASQAQQADNSGVPCHVKRYGAVGDGTTDDSKAINAAIAAAAAHDGIVQFDAGTYAMGAPLLGKAKGIHLTGRRGLTVLKKLPTTRTPSLITPDAGAYEDYEFENLTFDGNKDAVEAAGLKGISINFADCHDVTFRFCTFRDVSGVMGARSEKMRFLDCTFLGVRPGVVQAGTWSPPSVAGAKYGGGCWLAAGCYDFDFERCTFHFTKYGITSGGNLKAPSGHLRINNCRFRADWWNHPYVTHRLVPTAYDPKTRMLTVAERGLVLRDHEVCSIPVLLAQGNEFLKVNRRDAEVEGVLRQAQPGDVVETADGRRAEVAAVVSPRELVVDGWESLSTFEPVSPPPVKTAWRLTRYFASSVASSAEGSIKLYSDPVCVFTGERMVEDARISPANREIRILAKLNYSGLHVNGGHQDIAVRGCRFRGSWADQCSLFDSEAPIVIGNHFEYGQDEGITCTRCQRATLAHNTFRLCGTSAFSLADAHYASVSGNTILSWGVTNWNIRGAIEGSGVGMSITSNTATVLAGAHGGQSAHFIGLYRSPSTGTIISGNTDSGARRATLSIDTVAGGVTARDLKTVVGSGAKNVRAEHDRR